VDFSKCMNARDEHGRIIINPVPVNRKPIALTEDQILKLFRERS